MQPDDYGGRVRGGGRTLGRGRLQPHSAPPMRRRFGSLFRVDVVMKRTPLAAATDARAVTARLRIGDDYREGTTPCVPNASGQSADCRSQAGSCAAG